MTHHRSLFAPTDTPAPETLPAMFAGLSRSSEPVIGPADSRLLVIPIHDDAGAVRGGLWGWTMFGWLNICLLCVPEPLQRRGIGALLLLAAEREARGRGCRGAHLSAFSFQAVGFYEKYGYRRFGVLEDLPPGHRQIYLFKRLDG